MKMKYIFITAIAVFCSFFFHELAHWAAGELLGNNMGMSLNSTYPVSGAYIKDWHASIVDAAGPLFTIIQAIVFYFIINKTGNRIWYPFLLMPFIQRFLAMALTFINPNDEARISQSFGWGLFTLPIIVCAFLFFLVYTISKKNDYSFKFAAITSVWTILFFSILILSDQYFKLQII